MQLLHSSFGLALFALALASAGQATPLTAPDENKSALVSMYEITTKLAMRIVSYKQMMHWLATTNTDMTFVGALINPLAPRDGAAVQNTIVTYCSGDPLSIFCTGLCVTYNGPPACIFTPATQCISATNDVDLCTTASCSGTCTQLSNCSTLLANGFCYAPGTRSILVLE